MNNTAVSGLCGTGGERRIDRSRLTDDCELLSELDNDRFDEPALVIYHLRLAIRLSTRNDPGFTNKSNWSCV
jgi:hypothetical protein